MVPSSSASLCAKRGFEEEVITSTMLVSRRFFISLGSHIKWIDLARILLPAKMHELCQECRKIGRALC